MLANFFGKSNPVNFIIIFVIFLLYYGVWSFQNFSELPFSSELIVEILIMIFLFILFFFFFNFILAKNKLTLYNSYGFLFFVMLFGFFPFLMESRQELIVNTLLLIYLRRIFSLRSDKEVYKKLFDSGFWLSILFILSPNTIIFSILLYVSILLFQKLNFRTFVIPFVGFLSPLIIYFGYVFWMDQLESFHQLFTFSKRYGFDVFYDPTVLYPLVSLLFLAIITIIIKTPKIFSVSGNYRNFWVLTVLNFSVAMAFVILNSDYSVKLIPLFFPLAVIFTNGLESVKKRFFQDVILGIFVITPIVLFII